MGSNMDGQIDGYDKADVESCIGTGAERYVDRFEDMVYGHRRFNWAAAIFGQLWLAYRLMWKEALALIAVAYAFEIGVGAAMAGLHIPEGNRTFYELAIMSIAGIAVIALLGFFGDWLYFRHIRGQIDWYRRQDTYEQQRSEVRAQLRKEGGTSVFILVLFELVQIVVRMVLQKFVPGLLWEI